MKIVKITSVATSAKGKKYATNAKGDALFFNKTLAEKVKEGAYALVRDGFQTQNAEGDTLETPIPILVITSIWNTREEAIEANAEEALNAAEETAYVAKATKSLGEKYGLSAEELKVVF